jgi:hypothetical protein
MHNASNILSFYLLLFADENYGHTLQRGALSILLLFVETIVLQPSLAIKKWTQAPRSYAQGKQRSCTRHPRLPSALILPVAGPAKPIP